MTPKEQLLQEIEATPESILTELLDFLLFLKNRHQDDAVTIEEAHQIDVARTAYQAGDYITLEAYEAQQT